MKYVEYGEHNFDVIMLLHGGGLSWWNYREIAEKLSETYHVILPILDGHANSDKDFSSIEDMADELLYFVEHEMKGNLVLLGGLSLGGQIALEMLSRKSDLVKNALIESALIIPSKLNEVLMKPAINCSYGLIKKRWFAKLQAASLHIPKALFEEYYEDTMAISKDNLIGILKANQSYELHENLKYTEAMLHVYIGEKESDSIFQSANYIVNTIPYADMKILDHLHHGEFSLCHSDRYVEEIKKILQ